MTVITQTFPNSGSFTIPSNAVKITYSIRGGRGGKGFGSRDYWDGSVNNSCGINYSTGNAAQDNRGQYGQWLTGSFKSNMAGKTISFQKGLKGTNNFYVLGGAEDPGALGGAGYHNGGPGGVAPSSDGNGTYTCTRSGGPGGGGSSAFKYGTIILLEAGGGGAGGGSGNPGNQTAVYVNTVTTNINSGSDGGQGGIGSTSHNAGSGGGGGGCPGGAGGANNQAGNQSSGYPGIGGGGYYNTTYVSSCAAKRRNQFAGSFTNDGYAEVSYEAQIITSDSAWTTRSPQIGNVIGPQGSDPNNLWTTFLTNTNVGGQEPEGTTVTRSIEWQINFNTTGKQTFNTAVDDSADVYIDNVLQFSLDTYNINTSLTTPNSIDAGVHTLRIEHVNSGGPYGVAMDWTGSVDPEPPTVTLVSDDVDNTINRGDIVKLTYSATIPTLGDAITSTTFTATEVASGTVTSPITTVGNSGDYSPSPAVSTTYKFTATNSNGTSEASITITVNLLLPTASLTSNDPQGDNSITVGDSQSGDPTTLTWSGGGYDITGYSMTGVANPGSSGSTSVSPNVSTTYTYTVTNATGSTSATKTITVYARPVITLTAPTSTISRGAGLALTWATTGDASSIQWTNGTPVPSSSNINGTALVYPQNSTQYCVVASGNGGISSTVCFDVNVVVPDTSITDYDTTFYSDDTVYIPSYGINVTVDISAGSGGGGGTDENGSGGGGGSGRRATFYFPDYVERTFTMRLGNAGSNGFGCVAGSGSGSGGSSNVASGGRGGNSGPQGCSGGGGGGGGASSIYDSVKNGYVAVVGGGAGGGGASWNSSAVGNTGQAGKGLYNGSLSSIQNGDQGDDCPTDGGGGGGGGGGAGARPRGDGGAFGLDNNIGGRAGQGGGSSFDNSYCSFNYNSGTSNYGNGWFRARYDIGPPDITSFTATPRTIIRGAPVVLEWTSLFSLTGSINNGVASITVPDGSVTVYPQDDLEYTLTVTGPGGLTDSAGTGNIVVYIPPVLTLILSSISIILGGSANLSWSVSGDGDALYWIAGGITNTNLESSTSLSPSVTTTYTGYVTGLGGVSPQTSVILTVYYPPTLTVDYPAVIDYGQQAIIEYEGDYANTSVTLSATYNYDFVANTTDPILDLNTASSAEFGPNSSYSGTYDTNIVYTDRGPLSISYVITASGNGGSTTEAFTVLINVDKTPDNIDIDETGDLFKDADPVYTPETEILSEMYYVDDIDIQVEVKSNLPILVDLNANQQWTKLRQIGTAPAVQGNSVGSNSMPTEPGVYRIKPNFTQTEAPLIVKASSITAVEAAKLITCVSVIDETQSSYYNSLGNLNNVWGQNPPIIGGTVNNRRGFRTAFPYRSFYILDPGGSGGIDIATNFPGDANAYGPITVNRDNGSAASRSDWFAICNFGSLPYGTIVSIWIDISGSMTLATVQASYDYFLARCAAAGIEIVLSLSAAGERYIEGHIVYLPPSANFTAVDADGNTSNIEVISGAPVTLSWIVFGDVTTLAVTPGVLNMTPSFSNFVDSVVVNPTEDTTYTLSANGPAGDTTRQITISVLIPPTISITSSQGSSIITGNCTTLSWVISGDGNSVSWTQGGIANTNANSSTSVCPNDTTTYCAVASGPGGVSPETCITITVYQNPTASITAPAVIDYDNNFTIDYETQYANASIQITPTYTYLNGTVVTGTTINRTAATSAEINGGASGTVSDTIANGTGIPITVPWNNFGPYIVDFSMVASGNGGTAERTARTLVNIDQTPDNFVVDETDEKLKDADPVYTPETEILSEMYQINDIDIPVEIKADYPIKVDINKNDDWDDVRQI
jgi:hypothetical protein